MSQFGQITHTQTYVVPFHTKKLFTTLRVNSPSFSGRTVPLFAAMLVHQGNNSGTPTEPHHTPCPEAQTPSHSTHPSSSLPPVTTISIPTVTRTETTPIRQYTRRTRIAQSFVPSTIADEPDRATIDKSSTLPHDSAPQVTSPTAVEGSMKQTIPELTALCTSLQRRLSKLTDKFQAQEVEINRLKERVKQLEEREGVAAINFGDDAPIKGRSMDEREAAIERVSDDTGSIPTASSPAKGSVPTGSEEVPTASPVFATATVVTPVARRKGKEVKDFRGMTFEEVEAKFNSVWKQMEDFIPIGSKEDAERIKRKEGQRSYWKITRLGGSSACYQFLIDLLKHLDREDLNQLWRLVKETLSNRPPLSDKEMEL
nr:hypothetical protein [Tanacetum cinerariifolium]